MQPCVTPRLLQSWTDLASAGAGWGAGVQAWAGHLHAWGPFLLTSVYRWSQLSQRYSKTHSGDF